MLLNDLFFPDSSRQLIEKKKKNHPTFTLAPPTPTSELLLPVCLRLVVECVFVLFVRSSATQVTCEP